MKKNRFFIAVAQLLFLTAFVVFSLACANSQTLGSTGGIGALPKILTGNATPNNTQPDNNPNNPN